MKKIISLFAAVLFAGSMMAAETPKVTLDFTSGGVAVSPNPWGLQGQSYITDEASYTKDGYTITITANTAKGHKAMFTKSGTDTTWTGIIFGQEGIAIKLPAFDFAVSKIVVYGIAGAGASTTTNIYVGSNAACDDEATGCVGTNTFEIKSEYQAAGNIYALTVTNAKNAQCSKIEIYEKVAGAPENPTFSVAAGVYESAQSVALACVTEGAEIRYTIDGTDPTSSSALYSTPIAVATTTTIKAIAIKNSISSDIVSARYKIVELTGNGSNSNPYTMADVVKLENLRSDSAWVVGYIVGCADAGGTIAADSAVSNIALGDTPGQIEEVVPVALVNGSAARTNLNLVDNTDMIGTLVKVWGKLELYFTYYGVKGVYKYEIISTPTAIDETEAAGKATKELREGQVLIIKGNKTYNILGQEIK